VSVGVRSDSSPLEGVPLKLLIGGERVDAADGATLATVDPATGDMLGEVPDAGAADVDRAVDAARRALVDPSWRDALPSERERWLHALADALERDRDAFALLETLDNGMPIKLAERLVDRAVANLRYYAGWPTKIVGETMTPSVAAGRERYFAFTVREPVGVVGAIIPWNASITSATTKLGPALACGNTIVLKPSENTPLTVLRLAALVERSGLPAGVVNIITGGPAAGRALVEHPDVDLIAFTGSTAVGKSIARASADDLKRVLLELGGKSPNIIFADADLRRAIPGAARAVFGNSGQVCTAGSRIFVERSVVDEVREGIAAFARKLRIGPGVDPATQMGPVVSEAQRERILSYLALATEEGAELVTGGGRVVEADLARGYYIEPTVFTGVHRDMRIVREEVFGPVATITPFDHVAEVIEAANDTEFGLAAGVWTRDLGKAHAITRGVRAGCVWVNTYGLNDHSVPFGGYGLSGYGREYASASIDEYTELKSVWHAIGPVEGGAAS
jgi:acyl-CoA reductase-like NAD-dependent aldehyde dehydrogenase